MSSQNGTNSSNRRDGAERRGLMGRGGPEAWPDGHDEGRKGP